MASRQQGMALASVLFLLALLMVLALVLTDKVHHATRAAAAAQRRQQALDAAAAGIARGRRLLAADYAASDCWHDYLADAPAANSYPATPAFTLAQGDVQVALFVRDNPDGDDDWRHDNDLQLFLLARLVTPQGSETLIEALCGFATDAAADDYRQLQAGTPGVGPENEPGPVDAFHLGD